MNLSLSKPKKVRDGFPAEVSQENRRITGVTPRRLKAFAETPAKWIPKASLKSLMGGKRA